MARRLDNPAAIGQRGAMTRLNILLALAPLPLALAGCTTTSPASDPQAAFMANLSQHCGKAYAGRLATDDAADADLADKPMIVHFRSCSADRMEIPFHVGTADGGWNRSRTWIITRTAAGLRLKHDHRHEDGSLDAVTQYGGDTLEPGTATSQVFPVDAESIAMFRANGLDRSASNVWKVELGNRTDSPFYSYALSRPGSPQARNFRVVFDLRQPVAPPPAPWGW